MSTIRSAVALSPHLLAVLACPRDQGPLWAFEAEGFLYNPRLRLRYAIADDIPQLVPDEAQAISAEEHQALAARHAAR